MTKAVSGILEEIENALWEHEANNGGKPEYTKEGFRASIKIFMSALMAKAYDLQEAENMPEEDRLKMATKIGEDLRKLIKTYTNIDTHEIYN